MNIHFAHEYSSKTKRIYICRSCNPNHAVAVRHLMNSLGIHIKAHTTRYPMTTCFFFMQSDPQKIIELDLCALVFSQLIVLTIVDKMDVFKERKMFVYVGADMAFYWTLDVIDSILKMDTRILTFKLDKSYLN